MFNYNYFVMYFNRNIIGPPLLCFDLAGAFALANSVVNTIDKVFGSNGTSYGAQHAYAMKQLQAEQAFNAEQAELARRYNTSERLAAQAYQSDEWDRQFEITSSYNSPAAQVSRMRAAGLNPNALYEGADAGSASVSPLSSSGATSPIASSPSIAGSMLDYDLRRDYIAAQISNVEANTMRQLYDLGFARKTEQQRIDEVDANIKKVQADTNKIAHEIGWGDVNSDIQRKMYDWYSALTAEDVKLKKQQLLNLYNENLEILSRVKVNHKQIEVMDADITHLAHQDYNIDADSLLKYQSVDNQIISNKLDGLKLAFSEIVGAPVDSPEFLLQFKLWKENKWSDYFGTLVPHAANTGLNIIQNLADPKSWSGYVNKDDKKSSNSSLELSDESLLMLGKMLAK